MMKLIPDDRFSILTPKPLPEVIALLEPEIQAESFLFPNPSSSPFMGFISESGFEIYRTVRSAKNFPLIYIHGCFSISSHGVAIQIHQEFSLFHLLFTPILLLSTTVSMPLFAELMEDEAQTMNVVFGTFISLVAVPLFTYFEFYRRANVNRRFFYKLIHDIELPQTDPYSETLDWNEATADLLFEKRLWRMIKWLSLAIAGLFFFLVLHTATPPNSSFTPSSTSPQSPDCPPSAITAGETC